MKIRIAELLIVTAVFAFAIACLNRGNVGAEFLFANFTYLVLLCAIPMAIGRTKGARAFWIGFVFTGLLYIGFSMVLDIEGYTPRQHGTEFTTTLTRKAFEILEGPFESDDPFALNSRQAPSNNPFGVSLIPGSGQKVEDDDEPRAGPPSQAAETETVEANNGGDPVGGNQFGGGFGGQSEPGFGSGSEKSASSNIHAADFQPLIDLIQQTVGEDEWVETGVGFGTIKPFPSSVGIICTVSTSSESRTFESFVAIGHSAWALLLGWIVGHLSRFVYERTESATTFN